MHDGGRGARRAASVIVLLLATAVLTATSPAPRWEDLDRTVVSALTVLDEDRPRVEVGFELSFSDAVLDRATSLTLSTSASVRGGAVDADVLPVVGVLGRDGDPCDAIACLDGAGTFVVERAPRWGDEPVLVSAALRVDVEGEGEVPGYDPDGNVRVATAAPAATVLDSLASGATDDLADGGRWRLTVTTERALQRVEVPVVDLRGGDVIAQLRTEDGATARLPVGVTRLPLPVDCLQRACTATFDLAVAASAWSAWAVWAPPATATVAVEEVGDVQDAPVVAGRIGPVTVEAAPILPVERRRTIRLTVPASVLEASDAEDGPLVTIRMSLVAGDADSRATLSLAAGGGARFRSLTAPPASQSDVGGSSGRPCGSAHRTDVGDCILDLQLLRTSPPSTAAPTVTIDAVLDDGGGTPPPGWEQATLEVLP